jgi:hypothetical protein
LLFGALLLPVALNIAASFYQFFIFYSQQIVSKLVYFFEDYCSLHSVHRFNHNTFRVSL